jgi:hypothetical protein
VGIEPISVGENKKIIATSSSSSFYLLFSSPEARLARVRTGEHKSNELPKLWAHIAKRVLA